MTIIEQKVNQLSQSERGRHCLRGLEIFLDQHCWSLDSQNQHAVVALVRSFVVESPHDVLDAIREKIGAK